MDKAIKILKQEIDWHRKHTGIGRIGGKTDDWVDGFIKGCEHCLAVLTNAIHSDGKDQCTCGTFSSRKFCPVHGYKE